MTREGGYLLAYVLRKGPLVAQIGVQASNIIRNDLPEPCLECLRLLRNRIGIDAFQNQGMVSNSVRARVQSDRIGFGFGASDSGFLGKEAASPGKGLGTYSAASNVIKALPRAVTLKTKHEGHLVTK